ncbi:MULTISPECIES: cyclopropane-fatty-acyl-phospholipid synthase family protein [unclassified Undibacterium]|uniref:cyclopropane-fatty-acyl-phospholipid synthase family protein n=1 Tax=unclassified Undibacterium TaxID=2630295 RepID=UPI002AC903B9|nr:MULTISPECIES: cyclopropane-fatty-acyl-phospholipid synthase family protein [unclassified Undibacterium]MEB0138999.1 cyclopropane-fatty-acyl-phospholipid synthase family protein [Undibacterium sp. CCC2.1]MEB0171906.1 cyclopropane-fatty-acyl-phospholipid synthase family protein [Undibacterium sp. CCC1.1]MEB0175847.1 cyclopropane-fatty-acyl-phospholipid synthase family protein [Undibacterium sp. CCC3.4]MEB0215087.1 cyclopropane-fatty-acyl-phospholipid synthase family protein [Undibacterium sp. 
MNTQTLTPARHSAAALDTRHFPTEARFMLTLLAKLKHGVLHVVFPDGQRADFGSNTEGLGHISLNLQNWQLCRATLKSGDIGFAESYIAGHWSSNHLAGLIELVSRNRAELEALIYGTWWGNLLYRVKHFLNRNSRSGSKKNIHAHYDIGNDFYRLWLDPSMTYSSALFAGDQVADLHEGQLMKYRRILQQLALPPQAQVLEIGCGWGGFAEMAVRAGAAHVTGLTLSEEQLHFARARLETAGLHEQSALHIQDYRDTHGSYDAIASIEMFEAVGEQYWPGYFECLQRNLKSGGRACIQSIVIADELFERYRVGTDFIQQYIFPGGMLPSIEKFHALAAQYGFVVQDTFTFGLDYARTLAEWRQTFMQRGVEVRAQGFDDNFVRTWEFYLAYCEAGFRTGDINVAQFTLQKK